MSDVEEEMQSSSRRVTRNVAERWAINTPLAQREDRLPLEKATAKWSRIYRLFEASGESAQDEVFAAVNVYFCINGGSPRGDYARYIRTAGGRSAPAAEVVKITGKLDGEIRQFLRARMRDSYECLKNSPALANDDAFRDKVERAGVPRDICYVTADWLTDCEYFTPVESAAARKASVKAIAEANARLKSAGKSTSVNVAETVSVDTPEGVRNGYRSPPSHEGETY